MCATMLSGCSTKLTRAVASGNLLQALSVLLAIGQYL